MMKGSTVVRSSLRCERRLFPRIVREWAFYRIRHPPSYTNDGLSPEAQILRPNIYGTNSSPPSLQSRESFGWRLQIQSMCGPKWLSV